jgi:hypothetical protein
MVFRDGIFSLFLMILKQNQGSLDRGPLGLMIYSSGGFGMDIPLQEFV